MRKLLTCAAIAFLGLQLLAGCGGGTEKNEKNEGIDLSLFKTVVCSENAGARVKGALPYFIEGITPIAGEVSTLDAPVEGTPAIVINGEKAASLIPEEEGKAYAITFEKDVIEIAGSSAEATLVGMKYFLNNYVSSAENGIIGVAAGENYVGVYGDEIKIFDNLVQWEFVEPSLIDSPTRENRTATMKYPAITELNYQEDKSKNGILIATGERWIGDHLCPVYRSVDGGSTWEIVTFLEDPYHKGFRTAFAPSVYEMPYAVGDMPAGTLILGCDSINEAWSQVYIVLFRSYDQGQTWEAFATVASAPSASSTGGVWEPNFVCTEDGTLIVYYSDEVDPKYNQKLVLKYTKDGVNWSESVDTVALNSGGLRPGMPVVTRMGDGRYFMAYEIVGMPGNPIYYKISDNPLDWGDPSKYGKPVVSGTKAPAATPWVAWSPVGGENGMLVLTSWRMSRGTSKTGSDMFVSFDCGKTWTTTDNYYSYTWNNDNDTWGYSADIFFSPDNKTMYYMANPKGKYDRSTCYMLYKIEVT